MLRDVHPGSLRDLPGKSGRKSRMTGGLTRFVRANYSFSLDELWICKKKIGMIITQTT
jgi:hypothetical protein